MESTGNQMFESYGGEESVKGTFLEPPEGIDPDALLFLGDPFNRTTTGFQRWLFPGGLAIGLFCGSLIANRAAALPYRAGAYKHIIAAVCGAGMGEGGYRLQQKWAQEKDIQFYHYMVMHPEDFPAPERKKYGQVLMPWIPLR